MSRLTTNTLFKVLTFASILLLILSLAQAQEEQISEKDRSFYLNSIDQLSAANQSLQEQLDLNQKLIASLRAEIDSLREAFMELQAKEIAEANLPPTVTPTKVVTLPTPAVSSAQLSFEDAYRKALEKFNKKDYKEAIVLFQALIERDRNNSFADNCQYWIGESYYGMKDYHKAIIEFEKVLSFPNTNKGDDAQLKLGLSYLLMGDKESAKRELTRLLSNYPNSEYTERARKILQEM
jgi:tol-pal system protein YbgF